MEEQQQKQSEQTTQSKETPIQAEQLAKETREFIQQVSPQLPQQRRVAFEPTLTEVSSRLEYVAIGESSQSESQFTEADTIVKSMDGESLARHARHVWDQVKRELQPDQRRQGEDRISRAVERLEYASIGSQQPTNAGQQSLS